MLFNNQEALLFWNSSLSEYEVHSSEVKVTNTQMSTFLKLLQGSHSRFAPVGDLQCKVRDLYIFLILMR